MKKLLGSCLFLLLSCLVVPACQARVEDTRVYQVTHVIDGDTIILDNGAHVRLIGIDAPEMREDKKIKKDLKKRHLSKRAELAMGRKAYQYARHLLEGKKVRLEFDVQQYDEYHRLLAYVYLMDGSFVNAQMVKAGYAYAYPIKPDVRYAQEFRRLYNEARNHHRGLWHNGGTYEKGFQWFDPT